MYVSISKCEGGMAAKDERNISPGMMVRAADSLARLLQSGCSNALFRNESNQIFVQGGGTLETRFRHVYINIERDEI